MAEYINLPDGTRFEILPGETGADAFKAAAQKYPEAFGIQQKHGFYEATKAAGKGYIGAGIRGLGNMVGSEGMEKYGKEVMAPDMTPGAYHEMTDEEHSAAYKKGILPGLGASFQKYISEPIGEVVGRYAIPTVAGAATAAALAGSAPVSAAGALGAAGVRAVLSGAGFVGADMPAEQGENLQRQDEAVDATPVGQPLPQFDQTRTVMASLVQAALMPVLGAVGGKVSHSVLKMMGPEIAATTKAVASGEMNKEAAIVSLNSTAKNMVAQSAEMTAVGIPLMVGTEALRRGQADQSMTDEDAQKAYWDQIKGALSFAPIGALMGVPTRRGQVKAIDRADKAWEGAKEKAAANGGDRDTYEAKMQKNLAGTKDSTGDLDLDTPKQPTGENIYKGNESDNLPEPTIQETKAPVLNTKLFDDLKIKGGLRAAYEGMPLDHPEVATFIQTLRDKAEKTKSGEVAVRLSTGADHLESFVNEYKANQEAMQPKSPEQVQNDAFRTKAKQADLGLMPFEESRAQREHAEMKADAAKYRQEAADHQRMMQERAAIGRGKQPPTKPNMQRDMFSGKQEAVDMSKPTRPDPAKTMPELQDRSAELYDEFQKAHEEYQRTGDDTRLNEVLAQAKTELGPMDERLNQASTQPLFTKTGRATKGAAAYEKPTDQTANRAGDAAPVPVPGRGVPGRAKPVAPRVEASRQAPARVDVAEKPIEPALKPARGRNLIAPEVTEKLAGSEWEHARGGDESYPSFKDLHPDAKDALQAKMELNNGRISGPIMKEVRKAHKDAVRHEGIREELGQTDPDAHLYRKGDEEVKPAHTKSEAEALVNNITAKWKNAPRVHVVETKELSPENQALVKKNNAQGFVDKKGEIVILSDHNASLHEVKATLFHEALGHHGLRREFREGLSQLLRDIHDSNPEIKRLTDAYKRDNPEASHELAIEEVMAEKQINGKLPQSALARVAAYVRSFLRKMGLVTEYSDNDVTSVLRQAHDAMVKGDKPLVLEGDWAARSKKEEPFSKSVPADAKIMLEYPDGSEHQVEARKTMREHEQAVNALEKIMECLG